jgi:hypothetical protein
MTTLDVLIRARAEVEAGWCKGRSVDSRGNVCAMGALETALGVPKLQRRNTKSIPGIALRYALARELPAGYPNVPVFNDDPHTTKADVIELFTRAINAEAVKVTADPAHTYRITA